MSLASLWSSATAAAALWSNVTITHALLLNHYTHILYPDDTIDKLKDKWKDRLKASLTWQWFSYATTVDPYDAVTLSVYVPPATPISATPTFGSYGSSYQYTTALTYVTYLDLDNHNYNEHWLVFAPAPGNIPTVATTPIVLTTSLASLATAHPTPTSQPGALLVAASTAGRPSRVNQLQAEYDDRQYEHEHNNRPDLDHHDYDRQESWPFLTMGERAYIWIAATCIAVISIGFGAYRVICVRCTACLDLTGQSPAVVNTPTREVDKSSFTTKADKQSDRPPSDMHHPSREFHNSTVLPRSNLSSEPSTNEASLAVRSLSDRDATGNRLESTPARRSIPIKSRSGTSTGAVANRRIQPLNQQSTRARSSLRPVSAENSPTDTVERSFSYSETSYPDIRPLASHHRPTSTPRPPSPALHPAPGQDTNSCPEETYTLELKLTFKRIRPSTAEPQSAGPNSPPRYSSTSNGSSRTKDSRTTFPRTALPADTTPATSRRQATSTTSNIHRPASSLPIRISLYGFDVDDSLLTHEVSSDEDSLSDDVQPLQRRVLPARRVADLISGSSVRSAAASDGSPISRRPLFAQATSNSLRPVNAQRLSAGGSTTPPSSGFSSGCHTPATPLPGRTDNVFCVGSQNQSLIDSQYAAGVQHADANAPPELMRQPTRLSANKRSPSDDPGPTTPSFIAPNRASPNHTTTYNPPSFSGVVYSATPRKSRLDRTLRTPAVDKSFVVPTCPSSDMIRGVELPDALDSISGFESLPASQDHILGQSRVDITLNVPACRSTEMITSLGLPQSGSSTSGFTPLRSSSYNRLRRAPQGSNRIEDSLVIPTCPSSDMIQRLELPDASDSISGFESPPTSQDHVLSRSRVDHSLDVPACRSTEMITTLGLPQSGSSASGFTPLRSGHYTQLRRPPQRSNSIEDSLAIPTCPSSDMIQRLELPQSTSSTSGFESLPSVEASKAKRSKRRVRFVDDSSVVRTTARPLSCLKGSRSCAPNGSKRRVRFVDSAADDESLVIPQLPSSDMLTLLPLPPSSTPERLPRRDLMVDEGVPWIKWALAAGSTWDEGM